MIALEDRRVTAVETLMLDLAKDDLAGSMVREHLATGGKRLRARLALSAVEAFGGNEADAIRWACACELLHNATLIHDDVQDGDELRRGQPTLWRRHGVGQAINAGDVLFVVPFLAVAALGCDAATRVKLVERLASGAETVIRGQALEMSLRVKEPANWMHYERAIEMKTSALFALPAVGAAILCRRLEADVERLQRATTKLGALFQIQDDLLDLFGDKGRGQVGNDLREGKVSALVVQHLKYAPGDLELLHDLLSTPRQQTPDASVSDMITRFEDSGALRATVDWMGQLAESALAGLPETDYDLLAGLAADIIGPVADVPLVRETPALAALVGIDS